MLNFGVDSANDYMVDYSLQRSNFDIKCEDEKNGVMKWNKAEEVRERDRETCSPYHGCDTEEDAVVVV